MPLLLTDNGSEFSNPKAMEFDSQGNQRTHIFYCDPSAPGQKGSAERNHELIRYVLPKGTSLDELTQADINLFMDHVNSYSRESLGNKCPYDMFKFLYGENILSLLGHKISQMMSILHRHFLKDSDNCFPGGRGLGRAREEQQPTSLQPILEGRQGTLFQ